MYTIIIMESSSKEFWEFPDEYIHPGEWGFRTGVKLNLLAEFYFIPLDIFFHIEDNKKEETKMSKLEAWLYFIGSDKPKDVERVLAADPKFEEMYREVVNFRLHPEEAIGMFSKALKELDENTATYMIEELKQELEELQRTREKELEAKAKEMEEKNREMEEKNKELEESAKEIERLRKLLAEGIPCDKDQR